MAPDYQQLCKEALENPKVESPSTATISTLEEAFRKTQSVEAQIEISRTLGQLYLEHKNPEKAVEFLQKALHLHEIFSDNHRADKGVVHNLLATAYSRIQPESALNHYQHALNIFEKLSAENPRFQAHCGNTCLAIGHHFFRDKNWETSQTYYKKALAFYSESTETDCQKQEAACHFQLGLIARERFQFLEAKNHFKNAALLYDVLAEEDLNMEPLQAAAYNNVSVCFKDLNMPDESLRYYEKTLTLYTNLSEDNAEYPPYVAATYNAIAMVYAGINDYKNALKKERLARKIYEFLSEEDPEKYLHYWATSYHNCGVYAWECQQLNKAEKYFNKAYSLRKKLAAEQPAFISDVCVTGLNLAELYTVLFENDNNTYKTLHQAMIKELEYYIGKLNTDLPVYGSLKSDFAYYRDYFNPKE